MKSLDPIDPLGTARGRCLEVREGAAMRHEDLGIPSRVMEAAHQVDVDPARLFAAYELAAIPDCTPGERRAFFFLVAVSLGHLARGSTRLPLRDEASDVYDLASSLGAEPDEVEALRVLVPKLLDPDARGSFGDVLGAPGSYRPLILDGENLYHQKTWELERRVAERLVCRLEAPSHRDPSTLERALADVEAAPPTIGGRSLQLSAEQRAAVLRALDGRITLISGGPGTGKTSIVVSILRALARLGDVPLGAVALAAPTGKAADRMRRSIEHALRAVRAPGFADLELLKNCPRSETLHRFLGYAPTSGRYRHHERNPRPERFVIVDESSMIDLAAMDRLLRALREDASLLLLGDAHQLPSVDAGAVFRDLAASSGMRVSKLERSFRMDPKDPAGRNILTVARAVDEGRVEDVIRSADRGAGKPLVAVAKTEREVRSFGVERIEAGTSRRRHAAYGHFWETHVRGLPDLVALATRIYEDPLGEDDRHALETIFSHFERFRVLCLTRQRETGVMGLNAYFHARALDEFTPRGAFHQTPEFVAGEPLLVLRNDYERGLFNGDQGLLVRLATEGTVRLAAAFRRDPGFVFFPLEAVRPLVELGWAITVHKSQGSEYDATMIVLPDTSTPLLTRELLYTAITRSRRSVLLVGAAARLEEGVKRRLDRLSGITARVDALRMAQSAPEPHL